MNGLEIAAIITAIGGFVGVVGALAVNARRIDVLQQQIDAASEKENVNRRDIIILGENFAAARADTEILAEAFNQIWLEFYTVTGQRPAANMGMLKRLTTLQQSATGRLGPLDVEAIKNYQK
jgi:hypothetical protein